MSHYAIVRRLLHSFRRHVRQSRAEYQFNTRKARRVFHRLGRPSPSSVSTGISPGYWVSSGHGRRRRASTRPGRSPRPRARRARRRRGAGTRAHAARRSATTSGRRSASTRRRPCDLARSPRRSTAGGRGGARGGIPARGDGPRSPPGCPRSARSYSSRASSTQMVVLNDDRVEPLSASQFQPPSGSCSPSSRSTMPRTSWPK